ncbi:MAG: hypothetical protein J6A15_04750 [Clostridia bacterium]|nr:hypothetical protein [Clostridia bacterium]
MEEEKGMSKWKIIMIIIGVVVVIMALITVITPTDTSEQISQNSNKDNTETTYKYDRNGSYLSEIEINQMYSNPESFIGKNLKIYGKVFNIESFQNGYAIQLYRDPINYNQNTIVYYYSAVPTVLKENDYVMVDGYLFSNQKYENVMGTTMSAPTIIAYEIKKSSYVEVCSPTLKSVDVNQTQSQYGCDITVSKVEFAKDETRVYVTVTNNSGYQFNLYKYSTKIVQAGKQYEYEYNYNADYEDLQTDLLSGVTSSGIITFPAMSIEDFSLVLDGSSDNWDIRIQPYQFNVQVN